MRLPLFSRPQTGQVGSLLSSRAFLGRLAAAVLAVNCFVIGLAGYHVHHSRLQYEEGAVTTTQNLAQVLEENIYGIIDKVDVALLTAQDEVTREIAAGGIDPVRLNRVLAQQQGHQAEIISLRATDENGVVRYGIGVPAAGGPKNSDREYFIRARDEAVPDLIITKPVFARIDKRWVVVLARRLSRPDGGFAGVVYVNLALSQLSKTFSALNIGPRGSVTLRDGKLDLVTRYPEPSNLGDTIGTSPAREFSQAVQMGNAYGTFVSHSPLDGVERTVSYRKIDNKPLYVIVGVAKEDYLAVWRRETIAVATLLVLFVAVTVFSSWLVLGFWRRQVAASDTVRAQKDFLDAIFESEPECVLVVAPDGMLTQMNRAGLEMLEVPSLEEARRSGLSSFVLAECREAFLDMWRRVSAGESCTLEYRIEGKKGTWRWLESHATPLRDAKGEVAAMLAVARDISARKEAEIALTTLNETLEERVKDEVSKNLEKERMLIQQSRLAAMGEMIGNIAHQWRQPLNVLAILLTEIEDSYAFNELNAESLRKNVGDGQRMIQKMSSTIDDFRNFFRPNKEMENFSLGRAVADAVNFIGPSLKGHAIAIRVAEAEEVRVTGYPNELSQVLLNLFANAKEAFLERKMASGNIDVSWSHDGEHARLTVRDDAGGIPAAVLPRIFEPYFTTKEKGTGIGLYMSKSIMEHMNGRIDVVNVDGGAEFTVVCPLAKPRS